MSRLAPNCYTYLAEVEWIREGSPWRPPETITLRDEAGVVIGSTIMATMTMTLYDVDTGAIVNGVDGTVDVKNTRSCSLNTSGVFVLTLLPGDTAMLNTAHDHELRRALIEYTWPTTPTKSDALEVTVVIRNLQKRG
jgi:hypothetical protein